MRKKVVSLCLAVTLVGSLASCGKNGSVDTPVTNTPIATTIAPTPTAEPTAAPRITFETGMGIDFEDSKFDFIMMDTAPGDADGSELSIVDFNGSKALKVDVVEGGVPYVGIDVASLVGDRITDVRTIKLEAGIEYSDGVFGAVSGYFYAYSGEGRTETQNPWSIYLEENNPTILSSTLEGDAEYFVKDAKNFFVFALKTDARKETAKAKGSDGVKEAGDLYIDNIVFLDADGKEIPVDTSAKFDRPEGYGEADMSNLTLVTSEQAVPGAIGETTGGWQQAVTIQTLKNDGGTFDPAWIKPGCIVTVYYNSEVSPELVFQSWTDGKPETAKWAKVEPSVVNNSNTVCQYTYDDIVAAFGTEDIATYLDAFNVGDRDAALKVSKVSIGMASNGDEMVVPGAIGETTGGWQQAVTIQTIKNTDGSFDPAWLKKDCIISVYYSSDVPPELVFQSWTDGRPESAKWAKVAATTDNGSVATYSYEDIVASFGTEDFATYLDAFNVGDCDAALKVTKVTIQ